MRLEQAEEFATRGQLVTLEARQVRAEREAGVTCACGARATVKRNGVWFCALDARIARIRAERAAMRQRR